MKNKYHIYSSQKKVDMAVLMSKWTSFIAKNISKDKGCHNDKEVGSSRGQNSSKHLYS